MKSKAYCLWSRSSNLGSESQSRFNILLENKGWNPICEDACNIEKAQRCLTKNLRNRRKG
jgi:hypothetical protein